jgi:hypothetical protein
VQHSSLQAGEGFADRLVDSNFDDYCLIPGVGWESTEVGRAVEEVSIEGRHPQTGRGANTEHSLKANFC